MGKFVLTVLAGSLAFASCRQTYTAICTEASLALRFAGFTEAELDTVEVRTYAVGSGFANPTRTDVLIGTDVYFERLGDTLAPSNNPAWQLATGAEYEVLIPATGTRSRFSAIADEGQETMTYTQSRWSKEELKCVNAVMSYNQNEEGIAVVEPETRGAVATIVR